MKTYNLASLAPSSLPHPFHHYQYISFLPSQSTAQVTLTSFSFPHCAHRHIDMIFLYGNQSTYTTPLFFWPAYFQSVIEKLKMRIPEKCLRSSGPNAPNHVVHRGGRFLSRGHSALDFSRQPSHLIDVHRVFFHGNGSRRDRTGFDLCYNVLMPARGE
jgi:hypothetical protein